MVMMARPRRAVRVRAAAPSDPGGVLVLKAFPPAVGLCQGSPKQIDMLCTPEMLHSDFQGLLDTRVRGMRNHPERRPWPPGAGRRDPLCRYPAIRYVNHVTTVKLLRLKETLDIATGAYTSGDGTRCCGRMPPRPDRLGHDPLWKFHISNRGEVRTNKSTQTITFIDHALAVVLPRI